MYISYEVPTTKEQYWELVNKHWDVLSNLISIYHPGYGKRNHYHKITAQRAENICEKIREEILDDWQIGNECPVKIAEQHKINRSDQIVSIFNQTWFGMPESYEVRSEPGFGLLCDLCSESWCLEEPGEIQ